MTEGTARRRNTALIVVLAVIAALVLCGCALVAVGAWLYPLARTQGGMVGTPRAGAVEVTRELDRAFQVQGDVVLDVSNEVGDVIIEGTDDGQVVVESLVRAFGATTTDAERIADGVELTIEERAGGRIHVSARLPQGRAFQGRSPTVRFMIRVPRQAEVQVSSNVGRVQVSDLHGAVMIASDVGDAEVRDFAMRGDSRIETSVGRILIELPADSAFIVDAQTDVGDIDTEFDVRGASERRTPPGDRLQGEVGEDPGVELRLRAGTGDITIAAD